VIYWAPLLHFYQPPTQLPCVLDRICDECYRPLIEVFRGAGTARATFNVSGSLTEQLCENAATDVVDGIRELALAGKVELTGTAMYHPILPLIPAEESRRQIVLNQRTNRKAFGDVFRPIGFFPPELGFAPNIVPAVVETGHDWLLVSGVANPGNWPLDTVSHIESEDGDIAVFFRDDVLSNHISFHKCRPADFLASLRALRGRRKDIYVITAMDAETFGHHIPGWEEEFLAPTIREIEESTDGPESRAGGSPDDRIRVVAMSDLQAQFPRGDVVMPKTSSWSTSGDDLIAGNPFPLWSDPGNRVHRLQWDVTNLTAALVRRAESVADSASSQQFARTARRHLDRALHSCQFWWASRRPMWEVNMVHRGLLQLQMALFNAARAIRSSGASQRTQRDALYQYVAARELADRIVDALLE
jgi:alpha-amylase/alpha-mannosidase (GH57 family)